MAQWTGQPVAEVVAELRGLLELDHDAARAYALAAERVADPRQAEALAGFGEDHRRHVRDLAALVEALGGAAVDGAALPAGPMERAVRGAAEGGTPGILRALAAAEERCRTRYARHAERDHAREVDGVLFRNAGDEVRHHARLREALGRPGRGPDGDCGGG